jgi:hypothetical protein
LPSLAPDAVDPSVGTVDVGVLFTTPR